MLWPNQFEQQQYMQSLMILEAVMGKTNLYEGELQYWYKFDEHCLFDDDEVEYRLVKNQTERPPICALLILFQKSLQSMSLCYWYQWLRPRSAIPASVLCFR